MKSGKIRLFNGYCYGLTELKLLNKVDNPPVPFLE